jgi:large subunit ribosomal protein L9
MKVILTEKITNLGNIGDSIEVATGYARNYLIPKGRAMRWSRENLAAFESKKAGLIARHEAARKAAESDLPKIESAKLHFIRSAGDTGRLYGSVSSRDIARLIFDLTKIDLPSEQVLLGQPIKEIGTTDVKIALHPDVAAAVKVYIAQTRDEIDALVAGKDIRKNREFDEQPAAAEAPAEQPTPSAPDAEKPVGETLGETSEQSE